MNCQIVLDSWHGRGWTDSYLFRVDGRVAGYGLVGGIRADPKEIITEFYVLPSQRGSALPLFRRFAEVSRAKSLDHLPAPHRWTVGRRALSETSSSRAISTKLARIEEPP